MTQLAIGSVEQVDHPVPLDQPLELHDLQSGILHPRRSPFVGAYIVFRIDDRRDGRAFIGRLGGWVASAAEWSAQAQAWLTVAITYQGLQALGLPSAMTSFTTRTIRAASSARSDHTSAA